MKSTSSLLSFTCLLYNKFDRKKIAVSAGKHCIEGICSDGQMRVSVGNEWCETA